MKNGTPAFRACDIRAPKLLEVYYPEVKGIRLVIERPQVRDQLIYKPITSVRVAKAVRSRAAISRSRV